MIGYEQRLSDVEAEKALRLVREALALSSHTLSRDPSQLATQLTGRLGDNRTGPIQNLLTGARQKKTTWLMPKTASLTKPGQALHRILVGHTAGVYALAITADSKLVFSAGGDRAIRIWDLESGQNLRTIELDWKGIKDVIVSADGLWLGVISNNGAAQIWNNSRGDLLKTFPAGSVKVTEEYQSNFVGNPVSNLKFMPGRRWVVINDGKQITVLELESEEKIDAFTGETTFETFSVSPDESLITFGTVLGELRQLVIEN